MPGTDQSSPDSLFSLEGRGVLLTGATSGIGRRFAEVLTASGANVALVARRRAVLEELRATLPRVEILDRDLGDPESGPEVAEWAKGALGRVDVVINNAAAVFGGAKAEDEKLEDINAMLNLNLVTPIRIVQGLVRDMIDRGEGSIINVTSIVASYGIGRLPQAVYSATKGGLQAITREWAAQWSRFGVRVNAIAPGMIETEMSAHALSVDKVSEWVSRNTLLPRHGQPSDFDGALLYLASDASRYVTGQTLVVDGGWTAH